MNICEDVFTICIAVTVDCMLNILDKEHKFVAQKGESYDLTVPFTYVLGTEYIESNANFGFSSEYPLYSDPGMLLQNGVTITAEDFDPELPDTLALPNALLNGTYSARINFTNDDN